MYIVYCYIDEDGNCWHLLFLVWHYKWEWRAQKQVAISLSVRLNYEIFFLLFSSCYWFIHCQRIFLLAMSLCVVLLWCVRARACVRSCTSISNCKMDAKQSKCSEFGTEVHSGVLTIAYEREINKQAPAEQTCNDNKNNTETHKYESNERKREQFTTDNDIKWARTMAVADSHTHKLTHHFTRQYFSTPINLNLFWFVKYKNFILICCHAYLNNKSSHSVVSPP